MGDNVTASAQPVAILSIGDMGSSIARLLISKGLRVVTDTKGRSADTISRCHSAGIESLPLSEIVTSASAILSIVPPANAKSTAESVLSALESSPGRPTSLGPLIYVDLNAVSPSSARSIASLFVPHAAEVQFIDGAIIGGPPSPPSSPDGSGAWTVPQIPLSGPIQLPDFLASALGAYHISPEIGSASGLKMCFASLTKGYTAIAIQAFTTAHRLGVLSQLQESIKTVLPPGTGERLERSVTAMPPKAYRWVAEMEEIGDTFRDDGGWGDVGEGGRGADMFRGAARVYEVVKGTELGKEKVGERKRGRTVEDVAACVAGGLDRMGRKRVKGDGKVEGPAGGKGGSGGEDKPNPMKRMWEEDKMSRP